MFFENGKYNNVLNVKDWIDEWIYICLKRFNLQWLPAVKVNKGQMIV